MPKTKLSKETTHLLEAFQSPIVLLNGDGEVSYLNQAANSIFDVQIKNQLDRVIQQEFKEISRLMPTQKAGMKTLRYKQYPFEEVLIQVKFNLLDENTILLALRDISKEAKLIREYSTTKKELEAKGILQDQKERELEVLRGTIQSIFDNNPDDLLIINLDRTVREVSTQSPRNEDNNAIKTCYEFLGFPTVCDICPLTKGALGLEQRLVGHDLQDRYIQETITPFVDGRGALVSFQDATKKVVLIEKIREQRETIRNKNSLLENLVELMLTMHQNASVEDIADQFLSAVIKRSNAHSGVLFLPGKRKGSPPIKTHKNISITVINSLVKSFLQLPVRKQNIENFQLEDLPSPQHQWQITYLIGLNDENVGILILDMEASSEKSQTLTLFCRPMGAFIANRILTQQLETLAHHDGLTELYNRHYLMKIIKEEEKKFQTYAIPYSVLLGDANGLKPINDTYGHEAGDAYLIKIGKCIKETGRETDVIARIGGDEFCALLPDTPKAGGERFVNRLKEACEKEYIIVNEKTKKPISLSMGIVNRIDIINSEMLKIADEKMYEDKKNYYATHHDAIKH